MRPRHVILPAALARLGKLRQPTTPHDVFDYDCLGVLTREVTIDSIGGHALPHPGRTKHRVLVDAIRFERESSSRTRPQLTKPRQSPLVLSLRRQQLFQLCD